MKEVENLLRWSGLSIYGPSHRHAPIFSLISLPKIKYALTFFKVTHRNTTTWKPKPFRKTSFGRSIRRYAAPWVWRKDCGFYLAVFRCVKCRCADMSLLRQVFDVKARWDIWRSFSRDDELFDRPRKRMESKRDELDVKHPNDIPKAIVLMPHRHVSSNVSPKTKLEIERNWLLRLRDREFRVFLCTTGCIPDHILSPNSKHCLERDSSSQRWCCETNALPTEPHALHLYTLGNVYCVGGGLTICEDLSFARGPLEQCFVNS